MIRFNCPNCNRPYEVPAALARLPLVCKQCGQRITPPEPPPVTVQPPKPVASPPPAPPVSKPVAVPKPASAPAPKPAPVAKPAPAPVAPAAVKSAAPNPSPAPPTDDDASEGDVLVTKPDSTPDIDFNVGGPTAASLSEANRPRPAGLSDATRPRPPELNGTHPAPDSDGDDTVADINLDLLPKAPPATPPKPSPRPAPAEPDAPPEPTLLPFIADLVVFVLLVVVGLFLGEMLVQKQTGQVLSEAGSAAKFPPLDLLLWGGPALVFGLVYLLLNSRERTVGAWLRRRRAAS